MNKKSYSQLYVILSHGSRENFFLTRRDALVDVCKEINLEISFLDVENLCRIEVVAGSLIWIPYSVYSSIDPIAYKKISKSNKILITGGDEVLDGAFLQPLCLLFCDYYVVYDSIMREKWGPVFGDRILFMPEGYYPDRSLAEKNRKNGALYIGSPFKGRIEIIQSLIADGIDVEIYGPKSWEVTPLKARYRGYVDNHKYYETISSYKIFLSLSSGENPFETHPNAKVGDGLRARTISLTENSDCLDVDFMNASSAILGCSSLSEMSQKASYILSLGDDEYRNRVNEAILNTQDSPINYLVSIRSILLSAMGVTPPGNTRNKSGRLSKSLMVRALSAMGFMSVDEHAIHTLTDQIDYLEREGCLDAPISKYLNLPVWFRMFGKVKRFPLRFSLLVYCRKKQQIRFRFRYKPRDTTQTPDAKAVCFC